MSLTEVAITIHVKNATKSVGLFKNPVGAGAFFLLMLLPFVVQGHALCVKPTQGKVRLTRIRGINQIIELKEN